MYPFPFSKPSKDTIYQPSPKQANAPHAHVLFSSQAPAHCIVLHKCITPSTLRLSGCEGNSFVRPPTETGMRRESEDPESHLKRVPAEETRFSRQGTRDNLVNGSL